MQNVVFSQKMQRLEQLLGYFPHQPQGEPVRTRQQVEQVFSQTLKYEHLHLLGTVS
jgi:hypothetical protein